MDPRHLFVDERLKGMCAYCGAEPDTRDHVPSRVLLDEPFPSQLPVVAACEECNVGVALDEQYVACLLECALAGTADPTKIRRDNVGRILRENPGLRFGLEACRSDDDSGGVRWEPETDRVRRVALKLARGHAAYELCPRLEEPCELAVFPMPSLSSEKRAAFEDVLSGGVGFWPEIGSRAFVRTCGKSPDSFERADGWVEVQPGRYRYAVVETGGLVVRMVLSEYLGCQVIWE